MTVYPQDCYLFGCCVVTISAADYLDYKQKCVKDAIKRYTKGMKGVMG